MDDGSLDLMRRLGAFDAGLSQGAREEEVKPEERVLLVIANLTTHGVDRLRRLYQWLDENSVRVAKLLMDDHYRKIEVLTGDDATKDAFIQNLVTLSSDPQTKAVDAFIGLHGLENELWFHDGPVQTSDLGEEIRAEKLKQRLRLLYSTACYGASHAPDFIRAGFRVASGATRTNANGPYDYPTQLACWGRGWTYRSTVNLANSPVFIAMHDAIAKLLGFDDVNSEKIIEGRKHTRIITPAD
jgi:hypothetical protein